MQPRVLLTGASGFVGGAAGRWLRQNFHVTALSRRPPRPGSADDFRRCDLTERLPADLASVDYIVHCAALSSPWAAPAAYQAQNVTATRQLLDFAQRTGCRRFVFISSSSVYYRHGDQLGIREEDPLPANSINHYAATKRQAEDLVTAESGLPYVILRPRAVFGPGDTVLFPRILRAARKGLLPLFRRPDGIEPIGDLIYIDALSHYIECAMLGTFQGAVNLTNAEPVPLRSFLNEVFRQLGYPSISRTVPVRAAFAAASALEWASRYLGNYSEPPITRYGVEVMAYSKTLDPTRMLALYGPPPITVAEGLERFVAWQKTQP